MRTKSMVMVFIVLAVVCVRSSGVAVAAEKEPQSAYAESKRIISRYKTVFTGPPRGTPSKVSVDAPLLGNGDVGVCISGPPEKQTFWLAKNDFWRLRSTYRQGWPAPLGVVEVSVPKLRGGSYHIEQDLYSAVTRSVFEKDASKVVMTSFVSASANVLIVELALEGEPVKANVQLRVNTGSRSESSSGIDNGVPWGRRSFAKDVDIPTSCACAMRLFPSDKPEFTLEPGRPVTFAVGLKSSFETENDLADVKQMVSKLDLGVLNRAHQEWWRNFWAKSYVEINDPVVEKQYYLSLYVMGSCSRNPEFPPGIFGTWVTQDSCSWAGDYHLNYNHMAPFYALYSCNRIEQADPHDTPLLDFIEKGQAYAKEELNCRGVYYPVGIGPKGIETSRDGTYDNRGDSSPGLFCGQKSNASYCLVNIATRWYYTYDRGYAEELYPFAREVATFWEDYLTWDDSSKRYVIENGAAHENTFGDVNPIVTLALVRTTMELVIDMSIALGIDQDRHEKWLHILNNMSAFPTQEHKGREVFRYTEKGTAWWRSNTVGIQHIYPAGQIHLDSKPELIRLANSTIEAMGRWLDRNGSNSFFPAAVRVGYDPNVILQQLDKYCKNARPNGFQKNNPHGIENCSTVPNTVNEMLCMSHGGVLRLFPVWPREKDARFTNIRAWGAFLVSSEIKDGQVQYVRIESERGRVYTVQNPWPGRRVAVFRNGVKTETVSGTRFALATQVLEEIKLLPQQ